MGYTLPTFFGYYHTQIDCSPAIPNFRSQGCDTGAFGSDRIYSCTCGGEGDDPRIKPPFKINVDWKRKRERARQLELVVGFALYFTSTKEGGAVAVAVLVGVVGAYFAIRAMIEM